MTSIGALRKGTDKITANVNAIQWINRIISLTSPIKKQTQEYMAEHMINHNNNTWEIFDYEDSSSDWDMSSIFGRTSFETTKNYAENMITKNR